MDDDRRPPSPEPSERSVSPDTPRSAAGQAGLAGVYQLMAQVLQQQQMMQLAAMPSADSCYERFRRLNPPTFEGGSDPMAAETWIREIEKMFRALHFPDEVTVWLATSMLTGNAEYWWTAMETAYAVDRLTWRDFKGMFYNQYFPDSVHLAKQNEFLTLTQTDQMSVLEYANKFNELGRFCPQFMEDERSKVNRFEQGLRMPVLAIKW
ncbi:uncharacterized protein LOC120109994 [Phoenix dactylifera]|uniref:Uncharacterized protein LOC120109994 n=1 Tax=Phoenix dactylifera TaxID=42345 RepID=A0A8B8ZZX2_PHODC|nr:uncharacterized protein LOC120109994 [Phoenix dactylifera]